MVLGLGVEGWVSEMNRSQSSRGIMSSGGEPVDITVFILFFKRTSDLKQCQALPEEAGR